LAIARPAGSPRPQCADGRPRLNRGPRGPCVPNPPADVEGGVTPVSNPYLSWLASSLGGPRAPRTEGGASQAVMGFATGYGAAELEVFVRSLRAFFRGDVVLFVDQDRPDVADLLGRFNVTAASLPWGGGWSPHPVTAR